MPPKRLPEIEVLRAAAILMVLVEHLPVNLFYWRNWWFDFSMTYFRGAAGVDLFFVVSGFVIARTLLPQLAAGATRRVLAAFWLRRAFRLWPAAWAWIAITLALSAGFNHSNAFRPLADNVPAAAAAVCNVFNIYFGFFPWPGHLPLLTNYWSLSMEEQFYLLLPLLALLLRRRLIWLLVALLAYQFCIGDSFAFILTRPGGLAMGVMLALWRELPGYGRFYPRNKMVARALALALLAGLGLDYAAAAHHALGSISWGLLPLLSGALVYLASLDKGLVMPPGATRRVALWVGARSYSLYLVHLPCYALVQEIEWRVWGRAWTHPAREALWMLAAAWPLAFITADLTHRWLEMPLRVAGLRLSLRLASAPATHRVQSPPAL